MDFTRATRTLTEDSDWLMKVLIGGIMVLLSVLIIPAFFLSGYTLEVTRRAARGDDRLPAWDNWGDLFMKGAMSVVIQLVYALPVILIGCCLIAASALASGQGANTGANNAYAAFILCLICLAIPFGVFAAMASPAAIIRYAVTNDTAAAFNVGAVLGLVRDRIGPFLLALLVGIGLSLAAAAVSSILCGIPAPWLSFVAAVMTAHLFGQVGQTEAGLDTSPYAPVMPPSM